MMRVLILLLLMTPLASRRFQSVEGGEQVIDAEDIQQAEKTAFSLSGLSNLMKGNGDIGGDEMERGVNTLVQTLTFPMSPSVQKAGELLMSVSGVLASVPMPPVTMIAGGILGAAGAMMSVFGPRSRDSTSPNSSASASSNSSDRRERRQVFSALNAINSQIAEMVGGIKKVDEKLGEILQLQRATYRYETLGGKLLAEIESRYDQLFEYAKNAIKDESLVEGAKSQAKAANEHVGYASFGKGPLTPSNLEKYLEFVKKTTGENVAVAQAYKSFIVARFKLFWVVWTATIYLDGKVSLNSVSHMNRLENHMQEYNNVVTRVLSEKGLGSLTMTTAESMDALEAEKFTPENASTQQEASDTSSPTFAEKTGAGDQTMFHFSYNDTLGPHHANDVGRVVINFVGEKAYLSNQGFARKYTSSWKNGMLLGKADDYIWPIPSDTATAYGSSASAPTSQYVFTFDHGVSDLVFGNTITGKRDVFIPEFEEIVYTRNVGGRLSSPEAALWSQLREEQKESRLKFGDWNKDGYFINRSRNNQLQYSPRLKLKNRGQTHFQQQAFANQYVKAVLERPHILDIDDLFSVKPLVPNAFRHARVVNSDRTYQGKHSRFETTSSRCYPSGGFIYIMFNLYCGQNNRNEKCSTKSECDLMGGRWKNKRCGGGTDCGCCKHIKDINALQNRSPSNEVGATQSDGRNAPLPVEIGVQWLTPVLQKFQCVSVAPQYAKTGADSLYIAMGWDTESGVQELDLDLSLVPISKYKKVIQQKMVWYNRQVPMALSCGHAGYGYRNSHAMRAFNDDRTGDEPGDDELVKINLACVTQFHTDIEAIVVMANIYTPQHITWNQIDSAYLRIISGGEEKRVSDNFFVRDAEAVRSFVRLSGNDLHEDPELQTNGLAVGMFFRNGESWAFSSLQKAVPGRNVLQSAPHLEKLLSDLVYPANAYWDQTKEQQDLAKSGAFGQAGILGKKGVTEQIAAGELPCIASRRDQASLYLGRMNRDALRKVSITSGMRADVRQTARQLLKDEQLAQQVQGIAQAVVKMERARTKQERKEIVEHIQDAKPVTPTEQDSVEALSGLRSLFDTF